MLYVTTRTNEPCTVAHPLNENLGPDGGFFAPMHLPVYTRQQIQDLGKRAFSANVAEVVNLLFGTSLDSWAVEFAIGRYPVKFANVGNRTLIAETWHNPAWNFERLARGIEKAVRQSDQICPVPTDWLMIGSRMAVLFGIFGELIGKKAVSPDAPIDLVIPTGDFSGPISGYYCKKMGLPIQNVLCCCNDNAAAWSLIHKGEMRTDSNLIPTQTPNCDHAIPAGLERLVYETLGRGEVAKFLECVKSGTTYYLEPHQLSELRNGLYAAVVSKRQFESAVTSLYGSYGYLADPYGALCVAGIGAYRSKTGISCTALVLSEESPVHHLPLLAQILGSTVAKLKETID